MKTAKCSIKNVKIQRQQIQEFRPLITLIRNCDNLDFQCYGILSDEDTRWFLGTMESIKSAKINFKSSREFEFQNDHLEMGSPWITVNQIINMDLSTATIKYTKLSESDIISLVRNWFNSGNLKLKWLEIWVCINTLENRNYENLPVTRFLEDSRGRFYQ